MWSLEQKVPEVPECKAKQRHFSFLAFHWFVGAVKLGQLGKVGQVGLLKMGTCTEK